MKENPDIEELLNSFLDGELTDRQHTEVQRLISHDAGVAQRLRELQKCKMLVGSLPFDEAPAEMAEGIKTLLARRTPLGQPPFLLSPEVTTVHFDERAGARHLLFRKVTAAAAMIGLFAILSAVIYTIVAPESVPPAAGFRGRLELKTGALSAVNAFISSSIEKNGLLDCVSLRSQGDKSVYSLSCSRDDLNLLLADLESIWEKFDSSTLFVETQTPGEQVVVDGVSAGQIADLLTIPKPRLTRPEKTVKKPAGRLEDEQKVRLSIVVVGNE